MRLAFAADFHGSLRHFSDFLDLARQQHAAAAIVGGDILPVTRPHEEMLRAQRQFARNELPDVLRRHRAAGGCPVYLIPGNNDCHGAFEEVGQAHQEGLVALMDAAVCPLANGYIVVTLPYVPPTPFRLKDFERRDLVSDPAPVQPETMVWTRGDQPHEANVRDYLSGRPSIEEEMGGLNMVALDPAKTIYVMHSPPYRTGLDRTGDGLDVGSRAIRDAIEKHQPLLALHGHVHEAPTVTGAFACRLGQTVAINPGQVMERLYAVTVDLGARVTACHTRFGVAAL